MNMVAPQSQEQQFVVSKADVMIMTEDALLGYLKTPRTVNEMTDYFGCTTRMMMAGYMRMYIADGKVKFTHPEYAKHIDQKYYSVL